MTASMFTLISMGSSAKMTSWPEGCYQALVRRGLAGEVALWASTASVLWWRRSPLAA